jgi:uncharacterized membrane protein YraQ (UPF0718 family)
MKTLVKRYRLFLLLLLANIVIGLALPEIGKKSVESTTQNLLEMLAVIPPIFILLGLLDVWVDRATMMKYTGKGSGLKGILIAFLLGSAAAGPLYAAFPVAGVMLKKGSSLKNVFIFIGAWSTTKIPMLTFEAASLGLPFMLVRLLLSIVGIFAIALVTEKSLTAKQQSEVYKLNQTR